MVDVGQALAVADARFQSLTEPPFFGLSLAPSTAADLNFAVGVPNGIEPSSYMGNAFLFRDPYFGASDAGGDRYGCDDAPERSLADVWAAEPVAEGVGVAAGVEVAGTLAGVAVAGTLARDGVAVGDGCTVRCGAGVSVADLVCSTERGSAGDPAGPGVRVAAGCTFAGVSRAELACTGLTIA